jgi:hypothetical protein
MTTQSSCPNGRRLLAEGERLRAQWEGARKRRAALGAEGRRGRRSAAPFSRDEPIPGRESAARGGHPGDGGSPAGGVSGVWGTPGGPGHP